MVEDQTPPHFRNKTTVVPRNVSFVKSCACVMILSKMVPEGEVEEKPSLFLFSLCTKCILVAS